MSYFPAKYERETVISFNEESETALVDTYNPRLITKCLEIRDVIIRSKETRNNKVIHLICYVPISTISIRNPKQYSDETRQKMSELMKKNIGFVAVHRNLCKTRQT